MLPRNEPQILMDLYYCKDSSSLEFGEELLRELQNTFPQFNFLYKTEVENLANNIRSKTSESEVSLSDYVRSTWGYRMENDGLLVLWDSKQTLQLTVRFPPPGGVQLTRDFKRRPYFVPAYVQISLLHSVSTEEIISALLCFHNYLFVKLTASYSFICYSTQPRLPGPVSKRLRGVYWVTAFGPELVSLIGSKKFRNLPCYHVQELADSSRCIMLTERLQESLNKASRRNAVKIMFRLGMRYFFPPFWNKKLVLPFRFLR